MGLQFSGNMETYLNCLAATVIYVIDSHCLISIKIYWNLYLLFIASIIIEIGFALI